MGKSKIEKSDDKNDNFEILPNTWTPLFDELELFVVECDSTCALCKVPQVYESIFSLLELIHAEIQQILMWNC